jgi:ubiquinone/menaquinone biosynthesis C-methylase UbiE
LALRQEAQHRLAAESLDYESDYFDIVIARDILHHVQIDEAMAEIRRVLKKNGTFCFNEIYSHTIADRIRRSKFVDQWLYPRMIRFVYQQDKPYITEDEEKLTEKNVNYLLSELGSTECRKYFNFFLTRIIPEKWVALNKLDQALLRLFSFAAPLLGSRVLVGGSIEK